MNWKQINNQVKSKQLYLYGRSEDWVHKALVKLEKKPLNIIDRDLAYSGSEYIGIKVFPFEKLNISSDAFFVITAADYEGIVEFLEEKGFKEGLNYALSPDFSNYKELSKLRDYSAQILFSCSDYNDQKRARSSKRGGGLYTIDLPSGQVKKHYQGSLRQLVAGRDSFITVDYVDKKLLCFDKEFQLNYSHEIEYPNSCGLAIDHKDNFLFVANAGRDIIETFDLRNFQKVNEIQMISEDGLSKPGGHHINDLFFHNDIVYFSYFSRLGRWKLGILDGGVSCIKKEILIKDSSSQIGPSLISNLTKPHSPFVTNTSISVLNSMAGTLIKGTGDVVCSFQGFSRGIDMDSNFTFIGISEDMYVAERGAGSSTMLNSGICLLNIDENIYRFYPTLGIMNIHSLLVV